MAVSSQPRTAEDVRLAWATDIHLEFVTEDEGRGFCSRINEAAPTAVLIGGDIAMSDSLGHWLAILDAQIEAPIYFVLGNHDYYGASVDETRAIARSSQSETLHWLPAAGVVDLGQGAALVGHGGWGDARLGHFLESPAMLNDYMAIADLRGAGSEPYEDFKDLDVLAGWENRAALQAKLQELGSDAADTLSPVLRRALEAHERVIVLAHVPPFPEAAWHPDRGAREDGLPGFVCKAVGDVLLESAQLHPSQHILALSGHTHHEVETQILPNLEARTARARYGEPDFRIVELPRR